MRDAFLDVVMECSAEGVVDRPDSGNIITAKLRGKADEMCREHGAILDTTWTPELIVERAEHKLLGEDMVLLACRWRVQVPESVTVL